MAKRKAKKKIFRGMKKGNSSDMLLVSNKAKAAIRSLGCNTGSDSLSSLNKFVHRCLKEASIRAKANGRKTVRSYDFNTL